MLRPVFLLWLATGTATFAGLARMKLFALLLTPAQVGVFGNFVNLHNLVLFLCTLGMASAITQRVAQVAGGVEPDRTAAIASTALWAQLATTIALSGGLFLFPAILRAQVPDQYVATPFATLCTVCSIVASLGIVWITSVIQGTQRLEVAAVAATLGSLVSLTATIPLVLYGGFTGAFLSFPLSNALTLCMFVVVVWRAGELRRLRIVPVVCGRTLCQLLLFGLGAFAGTSAFQFSLQALRQSVLQHAGADAAGFLHVALQTGMYLNSFALAIGTYLLSVSGALTDPAEISRQFNRAFSLGCVLLVVAGSVLVLFGDLCIRAAFAAKFLPVVSLLGILAMAELFRASAYYASSLLLGRGRWPEYLVGNLLFCVPVLAVAWGILPLAGNVQEALLAYAAGGGSALLVLVLLLRAREGIHLTPDNLLALIVGGACLAVAHQLQDVPWWLRTAAAAAVLIAGGWRVLIVWRHPFTDGILARIGVRR